ncbi:MAG: hypothetical protein KIS67_09775 [Verrucomicrobiae bacterium]|nr:hypothetical protein [Verrucomicrobiae bacterium]
MKRPLLLIASLLLCANLAAADTAIPSPAGLTSPTTGSETKTTNTVSTVPGVELAHALSTVTGVAISPLLGVGAVGAWKYYRTEPQKRATLPWYARPAFWLPSLVLVGLVATKDILGAGAPTALKKPFDLAEAVENKISGLLVAGLFVPLVITIMRETGADEATLNAAGLGAIDAGWLYSLLLVPAALVVFFIVWLVGNAINVLIVLSPFTTVDTALKFARLGVLATVPLTAFINPWFGAVWAALIIIVSWFIAGWSFRLTHFGAALLWDHLTLRRNRFTPDPVANKMFLSRRLNEVPVRTYGKLTRNADGKLVLRYRPWLVLPTRTLELPTGRYEAGCGLLYCEILRVEADEAKSVLLLPPRYRGHEAELVKIHGLDGTREVGLRAAWKWLKEWCGFRTQPQVAAA